MAVEVKKGNWWKRKTASQKVAFVIGALILAISVVVFFLLMDARRVFGDEFADQVLGVGIQSGWEALLGTLIAGSASWILSLIVVFLTITIIFIGNFITHLFDNRTRKAKTISSLIRSLIKYITIIAAICLILVIWGVDVMGVIAGVGVLTLIIGLGCQTLIQDVVSGIFIVFDDYFAVGDMVIIDGFRGTITEVGLKTTKIQDFGGNIKSITNSSIHTVVNMSRMRSVVSVTLSISYNEDIERVEAIIIKRIEELKKEIPNIVDGPWYKGIDNVSSSSIDLLVLCFVNEDNRFQVTRDLKREFYLLFKKHDIQIPYPQVTINPQDEKKRKKATSEEIITAVKEQRKLRGINNNPSKKPNNKKKKFSRKIKESFVKAAEDMEDK